MCGSAWSVQLKWDQVPLHRGTFRLGSCSQLCLPLQFGTVCGLVQYSPVPLRQPSGDGGSAPIKFFLDRHLMHIGIY